MGQGGISGMGATLAAAGLYLMYAGIRDVPILDGLRELAGGRLPAGRPQRSTDVTWDPSGMAAAGAAGAVAGALVRPLGGPIGDGFGAPRPGGRKHLGVDIAAPMGTPIVAAAAGTVTGRGYNAGAGNYVRISHSGGMVTKYFHLSAFNVGHGEVVQAGQVIGRVGSTGRSSGPHLHFEVWVDGKAVDPAGFLGA